MLALAAVWLAIPVREQDKGFIMAGVKAGKTESPSALKFKGNARARGAVCPRVELKDPPVEYQQGGEHD
jgi:hypothetical protein